MGRKRVIQGLFGILAVLGGGAWGTAPARAQTAAEEVASLEARFAEARAEAVHLLAPDAFEEALDRLEDARNRSREGAADVRERLGEAEARLTAAEDAARAARGLFAEALAARARAAEAGAAGRAPQAWEAAEAELGEGGRRYQRGERSEAAGRAGRAVELYDRAAEAGWRELRLGAAIQARQRAISLGAGELAPATFAEGEAALARGEEALGAGRTGQPAVEAGGEALRAFERAAEIAVLADSVVRRRVPAERLVRAHEADLEALARAAGVEADPGETDETALRVASEIRRLERELVRLESALAEARSDSAELAGRVDRLEGELAATERRFGDVRAELLARRERDRRFAEASALFTPEEAEVFLTEDRLTLRLYGLGFPSGSDEIREEDRALLTKVERVILAFPGAGIRIEGHTDSRGREESNLALSLRRAIAVRDHLLTRIPIPSSRFEAVGLGETRPIASNESEEGRARNRRIDVVLALTDG